MPGNIVSNILPEDELKKMMVEGLNIGHLTATEQETVIKDLSGALMERAMYALLAKVPAESFDSIDALSSKEGNEVEMVAAIQKAVPDAQQVIQDAITSGVEEYARLVNEQVEQRLAGAGAQ